MNAVYPKDRSWLKKRNSAWWLLPLLIAGCAFLLLATHLGVGMSPDSAIYLGTARNLAAGKGLTVPFGSEIDAPLLQFPPLYPMLLSLPAIFGADPVAAAVTLQMLLFVANVLLIYRAVYLASGKSTWAAFAAALITAFSPSSLLIHQMAWSEGLFIAIALLAALLIAHYLKTGSRKTLLAGAFMAGLGAATRFAGLAFVGTLTLGVLLLQDRPFKRRFVDALICGVMGVLPLGVWFLQSLRNAGEATTRQFAIHPPGLSHVRETIDTLSTWMLIPGSAPFLLKFAFVFLALVGVAVLIYRYIKSPSFSIYAHPILSLMTLSLTGYGLFILLSLTFMDANIPLDERILAPAAASFLVLLLGLLGREIKTGSTQWFANLVLVMVMTLMLWQDVGWAKDQYASGGGFNSPRLRSHALVDQVKSLPEGSLLYSNSPEALYFQTGKSSLRLPKKVELMSQTNNENFAVEMEHVKQELQANPGFVVYYTWVRGKTILSQEELTQYLPVKVLEESETETVFAIQKSRE